MEPDRIHHGFWSYCDRTHYRYVEGNKYRWVILEYYKFLDKKISDILKGLQEDVTVYIVSDHGAQKIDGCFCINEWLIRKGYLTLRCYPDKVQPLVLEMIDWKRTYAWGEGGYYGRVYSNVKGREPHGIVETKDY